MKIIFSLDFQQFLKIRILIRDYILIQNLKKNPNRIYFIH
jgi:hypothetical protein